MNSEPSTSKKPLILPSNNPELIELLATGGKGTKGQNFIEKLQAKLQKTPKIGVTTKAEFIPHYIRGGIVNLPHTELMEKLGIKAIYLRPVSKKTTKLVFQIEKDQQKQLHFYNFTTKETLTGSDFSETELNEILAELEMKPDELNHYETFADIFHIDDELNVKNDNAGKVLNELRANLQKIMSLSSAHYPPQKVEAEEAQFKRVSQVTEQQEDEFGENQEVPLNNFEGDFLKLASDDVNVVSEGVTSIFKSFAKIYQANAKILGTSEAASHAFVYGALEMLFKYRYALDVAVERLCGKGRLDLIFISRLDGLANKNWQAFPVLAEFKVGTGEDRTPQAGIVQVDQQGYLKHFPGLRTANPVGFIIGFNPGLPAAQAVAVAIRNIEPATNFMHTLWEALENADPEEGKASLAEELENTHYAIIDSNGAQDNSHYLHRLMLGKFIGNNNLEMSSYAFIYDKFIKQEENMQRRSGKNSITEIEADPNQEISTFLIKRQDKLVVLTMIKKGSTLAVAPLSTTQLRNLGIQLPASTTYENIKIVTSSSPTTVEDIQITAHQVQMVDSPTSIGHFQRIDPVADFLNIRSADPSKKSNINIDKLRDSLYPLKELLAAENDLQAVVQGLLMAQQEIMNGQTRVFTEANISVKGKIDVFVSPVEKAYDQMAMELKYADNKRQALQRHQEGIEQNEGYDENLKTFTDGKIVDRITLTFDASAEEAKDLILFYSQTIEADHTSQSGISSQSGIGSQRITSGSSAESTPTRGQHGIHPISSDSSAESTPIRGLPSHHGPHPAIQVDPHWQAVEIHHSRSAVRITSGSSDEAIPVRGQHARQPPYVIRISDPVRVGEAYPAEEDPAASETIAKTTVKKAPTKAEGSSIKTADNSFVHHDMVLKPADKTAAGSTAGKVVGGVISGGLAVAGSAGLTKLAVAAPAAAAGSSAAAAGAASYSGSSISSSVNTNIQQLSQEVAQSIQESSQFREEAEARGNTLRQRAKQNPKSSKRVALQAGKAKKAKIQCDEPLSSRKRRDTTTTNLQVRTDKENNRLLLADQQTFSSMRDTLKSLLLASDLVVRVVSPVWILSLLNPEQETEQWLTRIEQSFYQNFLRGREASYFLILEKLTQFLMRDRDIFPASEHEVQGFCHCQEQLFKKSHLHGVTELPNEGPKTLNDLQQDLERDREKPMWLKRLSVGEHKIFIRFQNGFYCYLDPKIIYVDRIKDLDSLLKIIPTLTRIYYQNEFQLQGFETLDITQELNPQYDSLPTLFATERERLQQQDEHDSIKLNGEIISRALLYDLGLKIADTNLSPSGIFDSSVGEKLTAKKLSDLLQEGKLRLTAKNYLTNIDYFDIFSSNELKTFLWASQLPLQETESTVEMKRITKLKTLVSQITINAPDAFLRYQLQLAREVGPQVTKIEADVATSLFPEQLSQVPVLKINSLFTMQRRNSDLLLVEELNSITQPVLILKHFFHKPNQWQKLKLSITASNRFLTFEDIREQAKLAIDYESAFSELTSIYSIDLSQEVSACYRNDNATMHCIHEVHHNQIEEADYVKTLASDQQKRGQLEINSVSMGKVKVEKSGMDLLLSFATRKQEEKDFLAPPHYIKVALKNWNSVAHRISVVKFVSQDDGSVLEIHGMNVFSATTDGLTRLQRKLDHAFALAISRNGLAALLNDPEARLNYFELTAQLILQVLEKPSTQITALLDERVQPLCFGFNLPTDLRYFIGFYRKSHENLGTNKSLGLMLANENVRKAILWQIVQASFTINLRRSDLLASCFYPFVTEEILKNLVAKIHNFVFEGWNIYFNFKLNVERLIHKKQEALKPKVLSLTDCEKVMVSQFDAVIAPYCFINPIAERIYSVTVKFSDNPYQVPVNLTLGSLSNSKFIYSGKDNCLEISVAIPVSQWILLDFNLSLSNYFNNQSYVSNYQLFDQWGSWIKPQFGEAMEHNAENFLVTRFHLQANLPQAILDKPGDKAANILAWYQTIAAAKNGTFVEGFIHSPDGSLRRFGSIGGDVIKITSEIMFAYGGQGRDLYYIDTPNFLIAKEIYLDNQSWDQAEDILRFPVSPILFGRFRNDSLLISSPQSKAKIVIIHYYKNAEYQHLLVKDKDDETVAIPLPSRTKRSLASHEMLAHSSATRISSCLQDGASWLTSRCGQLKQWVYGFLENLSLISRQKISDKLDQSIVENFTLSKKVRHRAIKTVKTEITANEYLFEQATNSNKRFNKPKLESSKNSQNRSEGKSNFELSYEGNLTSNVYFVKYLLGMLGRRAAVNRMDKAEYALANNDDSMNPIAWKEKQLKTAIDLYNSENEKITFGKLPEKRITISKPALSVAKKSSTLEFFQATSRYSRIKERELISRNNTQWTRYLSGI